MKHFKTFPLFLIACLVGCSTFTEQKTASVYTKRYSGRKMASLDGTLESTSAMKNKVDKLINGVYHSHLIGQVYLNQFDRLLDKNPENVMQSDSYHSLLAVRTMVDGFEHELNNLYLDLVMVSATPMYSDMERTNAKMAISRIGEFMDGVKADQKRLPENLKPMALEGLRFRQTELIQELKYLSSDEVVTGNDPEVIKVLRDNEALLRTTRKSYEQEWSNYQVDEKILNAALEEERKSVSFKQLEAQIKALSKEMKNLTSELGRGTSSDSIVPGAGKNGNVSGSGYPANTWSLTFDDGPARTSPEVLHNLNTKNIKATFFMLAQQVKSYPKTTAMIKDAGYDIGCHSYTHAQLTKVDAVKLEREIGAATKIVEDAIGKPVKLFRLPYGAGISISRVRSKIAEHHLIHVGWSVDTLDWQDKNPQSIFNRALKQMNASHKNAGIILFHDIHPQSVIASGMVMDYFNQHKDIHACSVQGVVDQINKELPSCK